MHIAPKWLKLSKVSLFGQFLSEFKSEVVFLLRTSTKMRNFGLLDPLDKVDSLFMDPTDPKIYMDPVKGLKKT